VPSNVEGEHRSVSPRELHPRRTDWCDAPFDMDRNRRARPAHSPSFVSAPRQLSISAVVLLVASSAAAWSVPKPHAFKYSVLRVTLAIALGPISGWCEAWRTGEIKRAFALLVTMTLVTLVPLAIWIRRGGHSGLLGLATFLWFVSGYYFVVGMWI
jgi:hypothetical protein